MDAREADVWLKQAQQNAIIRKYEIYSDADLLHQLDRLRKEWSKTPSRSNREKEVEAARDEIKNEIMRRQRENEATE